jgi:hypothetical protein
MVMVISKFGHYHLQQTLNSNYCTVQIALRPYRYCLMTKFSSFKQVTDGKQMVITSLNLFSKLFTISTVYTPFTPS